MSGASSVVGDQSLSTSVLVPTYRRPQLLQRCIEGVRGQSHPAAEVVVVRREGDEETAAALRSLGRERLVEMTVNKPGVLAALEAGLGVARGDVVAFIDDDAVPRGDWLERLVSHFGDPRVGGVGGRDVWRSGETARELTEDVGRITSWGKLIGNHYIGTGRPRDVMVLQAVNMAFRREALALPHGLRGSGAQAHFEVAMCLWARRRGWRLVYDPAIVVDHFRGPRFDGDRRLHPDNVAVRDRSFNLVAALLTMQPRLLWRRAAFGLLVGDRECPGFARAFAAVLSRDWDVVRRLPGSLRGQTDALAAIVRGEELGMTSFPRGTCEAEETCH